MHSSSVFFVIGLTLAQASVLPREEYNNGPWMHVPTAARPDEQNYYKEPADGIPEDYKYFVKIQSHVAYTPKYKNLHPDFPEPPPEYSTHNDDIPFGILNKGRLGIASDYPHEPHTNEHASSTACGIPGSAYHYSKVAIHPWWLQFTPPEFQNPLTRWCMPDVCIAVWNETGFKDGKTDVMVKVTDICSTDPSDDNFCASPADIVMERSKISLLFSNSTPYIDRYAINNEGHYPRPIWWYPVKCLQDGITGKNYNHTDNWWANPPYPNQWTDWANNATVDQRALNQKAYPLRKTPLPPYEHGVVLASDAKRDAARFPIEYYWQNKTGGLSDDPPKWCPIAGGRNHFAKPTGNCPIKETAPLEKVSGKPETTVAGGGQAIISEE